jgi:hypothetical protein
MRNTIFFILLFIFFAAIGFALKKWHHVNATKENTIAIDTLLTKTIIFPDELLLLNGNQFDRIDSFRHKCDEKTKIISIVDGSCMKCIANLLNKNDSIFHSVLGDDFWMIFVINVHKEDSTYFMQNLQPAIKTTGSLLWDNNYHFETQNELFTSHINLRTFMINKDNKIIQYGNPVFHPEILSEYKEKLQKEIKCQ